MYNRDCERVDGRCWNDYRERIRRVLRSEYGIKRVPIDVYREQWAMGNSVQEAVQQVKLRYGKGDA